MAHLSLHRVPLVAYLVPLAGCVGTVDSMHRVDGTAPTTGDCEIVVNVAGTTDTLVRESVNGTFSVVYLAAGLVPPDVDVVASCNGVTLRNLKAVPARSSKIVQLGILAP